ncbi:hypothetical protein TNCV_2558561 [Trichonephila clavipes]|nr:hypothetical protein TNCV_2558561 [Trichonephila clavipes]
MINPDYYVEYKSLSILRDGYQQAVQALLPILVVAPTATSKSLLKAGDISSFYQECSTHDRLDLDLGILLANPCAEYLPSPKTIRQPVHYEVSHVSFVNRIGEDKALPKKDACEERELHYNSRRQ